MSLDIFMSGQFVCHTYHLQGFTGAGLWIDIRAPEILTSTALQGKKQARMGTQQPGTALLIISTLSGIKFHE